MPEKVASQLDGTTDGPATGWLRFFSRHRADKDEDAGVRDAIRDYALQFFIGHGGREEDWGENEELHVREEMYRRWKQTEWAKARARRREAGSTNNQWIGTSFDVGVFLGVNMFDATRTVVSATESGMGPAVGSQTHVHPAPSTSVTGHDTFITASSELASDSVSHDGLSHRMVFSRTSFPFPNGNLHRPDSTNSATPLLEHPPPLEDTGRPPEPAGMVASKSTPGISTAAVSTTTQGYLDVPRPHKGKGKTVHYHDVLTPQEEPAPPGEVLARTGSEMEDTSAGAAQHAAEVLTVEPEDMDTIIRGQLPSETKIMKGRAHEYALQTECSSRFRSQPKSSELALTKQKLVRLRMFSTTTRPSTSSCGGKIASSSTGITYVHLIRFGPHIPAFCSHIDSLPQGESGCSVTSSWRSSYL